MATSNSRHGVCLDQSSLAIGCSTLCSTARLASALSSSSVGGESGPGRKSEGMIPTLRRRCAYRCADENPRAGSGRGTGLRRPRHGMLTHNGGLRRDDHRAGTADLGVDAYTVDHRSRFPRYPGPPSDSRPAPDSRLPDTGQHERPRGSGACELGNDEMQRVHQARRRLRPGARWLACLVPAFDAGVGGASAGTRRRGAAPPGVDRRGPITLPLYFHWEFSTGPAGDFESLARRLQPFKVATQATGRRRSARSRCTSAPPVARWTCRRRRSGADRRDGRCAARRAAGRRPPRRDPDRR